MVVIGAGGVAGVFGLLLIEVAGPLLPGVTAVVVVVVVVEVVEGGNVVLLGSTLQPTVKSSVTNVPFLKLKNFTCLRGK